MHCHIYIYKEEKNCFQGRENLGPMRVDAADRLTLFQCGKKIFELSNNTGNLFHFAAVIENDRILSAHCGKE